MADWLIQLHRKRDDHKRHGRIFEMIPVQLAIITETEKSGRDGHVTRLTAPAQSPNVDP